MLHETIFKKIRKKQNKIIKKKRYNIILNVIVCTCTPSTLIGRSKRVATNLRSVMASYVLRQCLKNLKVAGD